MAPKSIALLSQPCAGIGADRSTGDPKHPNEAMNLALFSCKGEVLASLPVRHLAKAYVEGSDVVPACGLFLIQFAEGVVVVDARSRTVREDLSRLFPKATKRVAGARAACIGFAAVEVDADTSRILKIDFDGGRVVTLATLPGRADASAPSFLAAAPMAVSADDRRVAVATVRYERPGAVGEVFDKLRIETFDGISGTHLSELPISEFSGGSVIGMEFLDERALLFVSDARGNGLYVADIVSGDVRPAMFATPESVGEPMTLSYAASARRLAVGGAKEVRIFDLFE